MPKIQDIEEEIVSEFEILDGDRENMVVYIMELGAALESLSEAEQVDDKLIKGCQSKVWLYASYENGKVFYRADSNTGVTKGLISMLIRVLSGQEPSVIIDANLTFLEKIGLGNVIGSQRSNGLVAMIKQMKLYAVAFAQLNA